MRGACSPRALAEQDLAAAQGEGIGGAQALLHRLALVVGQRTHKDRRSHALERTTFSFIHLAKALGIQAFLPQMLERRSGIIITMESADGMPYLAPYLASKVGLRSLASSLAQELGAGHGVWVYCFGAGMVETPGGLQAFGELAPRYGMSLEEFIQQSAPGGHLISAELCAAGLVGTLLHAQQFHGAETDYVAGLALLGLDPTGERAGSQPQQAVEIQRLAPDLIAQAIALNQQMEAIVRTNQQEYEEQNMFVRPVVKRMFQQGTGLKVEAWVAQAMDMTHRLQSGSAAETEGNGSHLALDQARLAAYIASLQRMADYITKQEGDARGWMKDPAQLQAALRSLAPAETDRAATGVGPHPDPAAQRRQLTRHRRRKVMTQPLKAGAPGVSGEIT